MNQAPRFRRVVVPTEQVVETKDGQKVQTEKRVLLAAPVNMDMSDEADGREEHAWVTGFVGLVETRAALAARGRPHPTATAAADRPRTAVEFELGDRQDHLGVALRLRRRGRRRQRRPAELKVPLNIFEARPRSRSASTR